MANSETSPTIFLKLAQIQVQGYSGTLTDLEENLLSSFRATIFRNGTVFRISGRLAHCGIVYRAALRGAAGASREEKH